MSPRHIIYTVCRRDGMSVMDALAHAYGPRPLPIAHALLDGCSRASRILRASRVETLALRMVNATVMRATMSCVGGGYTLLTWERNGTHYGEIVPWSH